jgi:O-acetyl-ADP-ribose deacetylase (regulator of RNase III)
VLVNSPSTGSLEIDEWGGIAKGIRELVKRDSTHNTSFIQDWASRDKKIEEGTAHFAVTPDKQPIQFSVGGKRFYVIHAGSPKSSEEIKAELNEANKKKLEGTYFNILKTIKEFNDKTPTSPIKSVAIPPLGIGIYNVKPELSAECAARAIERFNRQYPDTKLDITIPFYPATSVRAQQFGDALEKRLTSLEQEKQKSVEPPPTPSSRPFDKQKLAKTTSWHNNCAFNCVVGFLSDELNSKSEDEINTLYTTSGYKAILECFNQYYDVNLSSGRELQALMQKYPNPVDQEVILGPVLRRRLEHLIKERQQGVNSESAKHMLDGFLADADLFFRGKQDFLNISMVIPNLDFLGKLRQTILDEQKKQKQPLDFILKKHDADLTSQLKSYWNTEGYKKYAEHIGDLEKKSFISEQELDLLTKNLNLGLRVYAPDTQDKSLEPSVVFSDLVQDHSRTIIVFNGGDHWEREVDSMDYAVEHNAFYSYFGSDLRSVNAENIKARVQRTVSALKESTPKPPRSETKISPEARETSAAFEPSQTEPKAKIVHPPHAQRKAMTYAFNGVRMLKRDPHIGKPVLAVNVMTSKEFDEICKKEIEKLETMNQSSNGSHLEEGLDKVNMYTMLSATQTKLDGISTLIISETMEDGNQEPIINVSHDQRRDLVQIVSEHSDPSDQAVLEMVLFAEQCSKNGRFNIENCEENAEAAIKLYLFGKSLGLTPQLNAETLEAMYRYIREPNKDSTLAQIYQEVIGRPDWSGEVVLSKLKQWEVEKAKRDQQYSDGLST